MFSHKLNCCSKCGFAYVVTVGSLIGRTEEIELCPIDSTLLATGEPENVAAVQRHLSAEKYETGSNYIIYPQIHLINPNPLEDGNYALMQNFHYEERINEQLKQQFLAGKGSEKDGFSDYHEYIGRVLGGFGFKLENYLLRIAHYTGQADLQWPMINLVNIFTVDLGFVAHS